MEFLSTDYQYGGNDIFYTNSSGKSGYLRSRFAVLVDQIIDKANLSYLESLGHSPRGYGMMLGDPPNKNGDGFAVNAAATYMIVLQADLITPDPSDAAWPKWIGHTILGTTSALILYISGKSVLNPNLEGTTTSRGNPTDWSFDPRIRALENDKYYQPGSKPPRWFWPAIIGAGSYELYKDWPKRGTDQPIDNIYIEPTPIYPFEYKQGN
jgi:hypothetical protein